MFRSCHARRPQRRGREDRLSMPVQTLTPITATEQSSIVRCAACHATLDDHTARATCPNCGGLLAVEHTLALAKGAALRAPFVARAAVTSFAGVDDLWLKHEGHNPSASFKDRGMTAALTQARRIGALAVACASTGNTSASLAAYAAQAGIPAFVLVPEGRVSTGKLAQTLAYGAHMIRLRGDFDDCLELAREASELLR